MKQQEILERLTARFGGDVIRSITFLDQVTALAPAEKIVEICEFLKTDPELNFDMLTFVGGVDRMPAVPRFEVVYQLYSVKQKHRFRVKAPLEDPSEGLPCIDTVTGVWTTANWHERETSEMYGITFLNHPDPRKLLLPEEWSVCPLRKDFPVEGTDETPDLPHNHPSSGGHKNA